MDIGYTSFAKPDVHLKALHELDLSPSKDDYQVFAAILRVARSVGVTPFQVDRVFWLIGSGKFYLENPKVTAGGQRDNFIAYAKSQAQPFTRQQV